MNNNNNNYHEWLENWKEDMQKHYSDKRRVRKRGFAMEEHNCVNCSLRYSDGFCMQHCYYTGEEQSCPQWTNEEIEFNYSRIYGLCKDYIKLCNDYENYKELCDKYLDRKLMDGE